MRPLERKKTMEGNKKGGERSLSPLLTYILLLTLPVLPVMTELTTRDA